MPLVVNQCPIPHAKRLKNSPAPETATRRRLRPPQQQRGNPLPLRLLLPLLRQFEDVGGALGQRLTCRRPAVRSAASRRNQHSNLVRVTSSDGLCRAHDRENRPALAGSRRTRSWPERATAAAFLSLPALGARPLVLKVLRPDIRRHCRAPSQEGLLEGPQCILKGVCNATGHPAAVTHQRHDVDAPTPRGAPNNSALSLTRCESRSRPDRGTISSSCASKPPVSRASAGVDDDAMKADLMTLAGELEQSAKTGRGD